MMQQVQHVAPQLHAVRGVQAINFFLLYLIFVLQFFVLPHWPSYFTSLALYNIPTFSIRCNKSSTWFLISVLSEVCR